MAARTRIVPAVVIALALAACGGSDEPSGNGGTTSPGPTGPTGSVTVQNLAFSPENTTVAAGTVVTWTNRDDFAHTVTSGNPSDAPSGVFDGALETNGATFTFPFKDAGTFEYYCKIHPQMTGSVVVS